MAIEITVPRLGWSAEEATFACWLKNEGEKVAAGEALFELEGDKSLQEIESMDSGFLRLLPNSPKTGDVVKVGQLIGYLAAEDEQLSSANDSSIQAVPAKVVSTAVEVPAPVIVAEIPTVERTSTPRARRVSTELGVDLSLVVGSGKGGRVRERDVQSAAEQVNRSVSVASAIEGSHGQIVSVMRRTIADRMMQSLGTTAPVTLTSRIDATNLVALRKQFKSSKSDTLVPAYTDIVAKLAATAIARHPAIIGQWKGDKIITPSVINIGIAVDTEYGLVVPVIPDVPQLSLAQVARTSRSLIDSAHARKLKPEAMSRGVFTITNLGGFEIDAFTPIINAPETAILGLGAIRLEPAVVDGKNITVREQMTLSLTFDHRVLDGAPAARFLQELIRGLENPIVWLLEVPSAAPIK